MSAQSKPTLSEFLTQRWDERLDRLSHWSGCKAPDGGDCSCTGTLGERNHYALADIAAKRQILQLHSMHEDVHEDGRCAECGDGEPDTGPGDRGWFEPMPWPCETVRLLAAPFSVHPDYQEAWLL